MSDNLPFPALSLSLIVPTYNRADLISQTLDSALSQGVPFAEVIVVDDGSTDTTAAVLASFGNRIRIVRTSNQGVQAARNTGVAAANTPLIALCDSDDLLEPNFVEKAAGWMSMHGEAHVLFGNFRTFDAQSTGANKFSKGPNDYLTGATTDGDVYFPAPDLYPYSPQHQAIDRGLIF